MHSVQCSDCKKEQSELPRPCSLTSIPGSFSVIKCGSGQDQNVPIYGPNEIPISDCLDMVNNTVDFCKILILRAPARAQAVLLFTIDRLAEEARKCCRAGGLWKTCFQPLANKFHNWNQKWKMFGIPPDPAWD